MMTKIHRDEKGFTLIELMVVILIIGILVAIAVPVFNAARGEANKRSCQSNMRVLDGAVQTWKAANPGVDYPSTYDTLKTALEGTYVKTWPTCPSGADNADNSANYKVTGGGGSVAPVIECPNGHTY